jgi:hypothetical protein
MVLSDYCNRTSRKKLARHNEILRAIARDTECSNPRVVRDFREIDGRCSAVRTARQAKPISANAEAISHCEIDRGAAAVLMFGSITTLNG